MYKLQKLLGHLIVGLAVGLIPILVSVPAHAQPEPSERAATHPTVVRAIESFTPRKAAFDCTLGFFCVWQGYNGTGKRCSWDVTDPNWYNGTITCGWADTYAVRSIRNNGRYQDVRYCTKPDGGGKCGFSAKGTRGNLPMAYILGSHYWIN